MNLNSQIHLLEQLTQKGVLLKEHTIVNPPPKTGMSKPQELIDKCKKADCMKSLDGISLGQDKKGYYVYTHRARSKSYPKPENISIKDIKFIETTG